MSTNLFQLCPELRDLILPILIRDGTTNGVRGSGLGGVRGSGGDVTWLLMLGLLARDIHVSTKVLGTILLGRD